MPANLVILYLFVFEAIIWHHWSPNMEVEPKKSHVFEIDPINFFITYYKMITVIYNDLWWFTTNYNYNLQWSTINYNDPYDIYNTYYNQLDSRVQWSTTNYNPITINHIYDYNDLQSITINYIYNYKDLQPITIQLQLPLWAFTIGMADNYNSIVIKLSELCTTACRHRPMDC